MAVVELQGCKAWKLLFLVLLMFHVTVKASNLPSAISDAVIEACLNVKAKQLAPQPSSDLRTLLQACGPVFQVLTKSNRSQVSLDTNALPSPPVIHSTVGYVLATTLSQQA